MVSTSGVETTVNLLDLSAAFDTIDHDILFSRLEHGFGIKGTALKWFHSYMTGRQFRVSVGNVFSDYYDLKCGVPQGSILGPLLFLLYMNYSLLYFNGILFKVII